MNSTAKRGSRRTRERLAVVVTAKFISWSGAILVASYAGVNSSYFRWILPGADSMM